MLSALQSSLHRASLTGAWRRPSLLCESPSHMPLQAQSQKLTILCSVTDCDQYFCSGPCAQCSESQCYDNRTSGALGWAATLDILLMMYPVPRSTFLHWMMGESFPTLIKYHRWGRCIQSQPLRLCNFQRPRMFQACTHVRVTNDAQSANLHAAVHAVSFFQCVGAHM